MNDFLTIVLDHVVDLFIASVKIFGILLGTVTILFLVVVMLVYIYVLVAYLIQDAAKAARANIANKG